MLLLQVPAIDTTATSLSATTAAQPQTLQLFDLVAKGGWVMIPIAFLLFSALYLIFERYFVIRSQSRYDANFIDNIRDMVAQGNIKSAESFAKNQRTAMGRVFEKAIGRIGSPIREIESTIETVGQIELSRLERNMGYLGIIAGIAPMLGFIGTISGIIRIFYDISLSDNISVGIIAGGLVRKNDHLGLRSDCGRYCLHRLSPAQYDDRAVYPLAGSKCLRVYRSSSKTNDRTRPDAVRWYQTARCCLRD